jgi:hypothetical protein
MKEIKTKSCKVFIHQPDFAPWLTFFKRIFHADIYVILDDVQFNRRGFINRDYLNLNKKKSLITIPIIKTNRDKTLIKDVKIHYDNKWIEKFLKTIFINYKNTNNYGETYKFLKGQIDKRHKYLIDLNLDIIKFVIKELEIDIKIYHASELDINTNKSDRILDICKKLKATEYITGMGSDNYLEPGKFKNENIKINQNIFFNNTYTQENKKFIPNLSILDVMFNQNFENIKKIIK